jgi:GNAT superfamily N-acetyltransferase
MPSRKAGEMPGATNSRSELLHVPLLIRQAVTADISALRVLIETSVRQLQAGDYTPRQLEGALETVYGVDSQLIADGTYYTAESKAAEVDVTLVGCGGWSKRKTLFGGDRWTARQDELLDPRRDAARIRAFFVAPAWARRGIGSLILEACESAAKAAGFTRLEMGATLTGVPFYRAKGYVELEHLVVPLANGESLPIVRMAKEV